MFPLNPASLSHGQVVSVCIDPGKQPEIDTVADCCGGAFLSCGHPRAGMGREERILRAFLNSWLQIVL